ncbi:MAG: hypothetical protein ACI9HY_004179 [Planctomycetaceae bacterium]|jgi:hypothetical protein
MKSVSLRFRNAVNLRGSVIDSDAANMVISSHAQDPSHPFRRSVLLLSTCFSGAGAFGAHFGLA